MNITKKLKRCVLNLVYDCLPNQYSICEENPILALYDEDFIITKTENFAAGMTLQGLQLNVENLPTIENMRLPINRHKL